MHKLVSYTIDLDIEASLPFIQKAAIDGVSMSLATRDSNIPLLIKYEQHEEHIMYWDNTKTSVRIVGNGRYALASIGLDSAETLPPDTEFNFKGLPSVGSMYTVIVDCQTKEETDIPVTVKSVSFHFESGQNLVTITAQPEQLEQVNL